MLEVLHQLCLVRLSNNRHDYRIQVQNYNRVDEMDQEFEDVVYICVYVVEDHAVILNVEDLRDKEYVKFV